MNASVVVDLWGGAGGRFRVLRELGRGASGTVVLARDSLVNDLVAIKLLRGRSDASLLRFRNEFRALSEISHPNLVELYELGAEQPPWHLVMEYVDGDDLLSALRGALPTEDGDTDHDSDTATMTLSEESAQRAAVLPHSHRPINDARRLGEVFSQFARGVQALHDRSLLHCDLKPSNVLVARGDGRVVILDFGLVRGVSSVDARAHHSPAGTPMYMAPEVAAGGAAVEASDWYAVGVMLYEALTGRWPFLGSTEQTLWLRQVQVPTPPSQLAPSVDPGWEALCLSLLATRPEARAGGDDVVRQIAALQGTPVAAPTPRVVARDWRLIGRDDERQKLMEFCELSAPSTLSLKGPSGVGKSAVLEDLCAGLRGGRALVLQGRCHAFEAVQANAVDAVMEALALALTSAEHRGLAASVEAETSALRRVFPGLARLSGATAAGVVDAPTALVFALRALFAKLCAAREVTLVIDDMQWCDRPSVELLMALLAPPTPALRLVLAHRSEEDGGANFQHLRQRLSVCRWIAQSELTLGPLRDGAVTALMTALGLTEAQAEALRGTAAEATPLLIEELVSAARDADLRDRSGLTLDALLAERIARCSEPERAVLTVVAVAQAPLSEGALSRAVALPESFRPMVRSLLRQRLLRRVTAFDAREVLYDTHHDRIREVALRSLGDDLHRAASAALVRALDDGDPRNALSLARHCQRAGLDDAARVHIERAAERATEQFALEHATALYAEAIAMLAVDDPRRVRLLEARARALVAAGSLHEAARSLLDAAALEVGVAAAQLRRRAAEHMLTAGYAIEGRAMLDAVAHDVGMRMPRGPVDALALLALRRAQLSVANLFPAGPVRPPTPSEALRLDVGRSIVFGLGLVTPLSTASFHLANQALIQRVDDPHRELSIKMCEAVWRGALGTRFIPEARVAIARMYSLAGQSADPEAIALARGTEGVHCVQVGDFARALPLLDASLDVLTHRATESSFELATAQHFTIFARYYTGMFSELAQSVPYHAKRATDSGDVFAGFENRTQHATTAWLAVDDVAGAKAALGEAIASWPLRIEHVQNYYALSSAVHIDLYEGEGAAAWHRVWPRFAAVRLARVTWIEGMLIDSMAMRARVALAALEKNVGGTIAWGVLAEAVFRLRSSDAAWGRHLGELYYGAGLLRLGRTRHAARVLVLAQERLEGHGMLALALCAKRVLAILRNDDVVRAQAEQALRALGVVRPRTFAEMLLPGLRDTLPGGLHDDTDGRDAR